LLLRLLDEFLETAANCG